jgi:hypothetical protein
MGDEMKKIVFCEGKDDVAVVRGLATHLGLDVEVESYDGKNQVPILLQSLLKRPEFAQQKVAAIAILRDADADSKAAFTSVRESLRQNNFEAPAADGAFSESALKVGVFIVGVNGRGMIEDLCLQSVSDQPEFPCVDSYFACITEKSGRSNFSSKGKVRVWMASHVDYDLRVGKAAEEGYWPWESPAFDSLKNFLKAL